MAAASTSTFSVTLRRSSGLFQPGESFEDRAHGRASCNEPSCDARAPQDDGDKPARGWSTESLLLGGKLRYFVDELKARHPEVLWKSGGIEEPQEQLTPRFLYHPVAL